MEHRSGRGEAGSQASGLRPSGSWRSACRIAAALAFAIAVASGLASTGALLTRTPGAGATAMAQEAPPRTPLCGSAGKVTRLVVRRTEAFRQDRIRFSFASSVAVGEPAAVRKVVRALCALPAMPQGAMFCPNDLGIDYHLHLSRGSEHFRAVVLDATGCQSVSGLEPTRWVARSPGFWRVLGTAMHLKPPSWTTFRGTGPTD